MGGAVGGMGVSSIVSGMSQATSDMNSIQGAQLDAQKQQQKLANQVTDMKQEQAIFEIALSSKFRLDQ